LCAAKKNEEMSTEGRNMALSKA